MLLTSKNLSGLLSTIGKPLDLIPTGFKELDNLVGGLLPGELVVIAARPGMGKTSLVLDLASQIGRKHAVLFLSLEMQGNLLMERLLSSKAAVPKERLHCENMTQEEMDRITVATDNINGLSLFVDDDPTFTPNRFDRLMEQFVAKHSNPLVIIDYFQLCRANTQFQNRTYELQNVLEYMLVTIKKYGARCILTSQLNREADKRENHWPKLSDLRDTGFLEQAADKVIFIHRPDYYSVSEGDFNTTDTGESYLVVAKNRHGRTGFVKLAYVADITSFKNIGKDDTVEVFDPDEIPF
jgi:replicative DNA helicase